MKVTRGIDIGSRWGRLVVTSEVFLVKDSRQRNAHVMVRCDCGNEKSVRARSLKAGNTRSCGCFHLESVKRTVAKLNTVEDGNVGDRYGLLVVIGEKELRKRSKIASVNYVKCRCDCGNVVEFPLHRLRCGHVISCGCVKTGKDYRPEDEHYAETRLFHIWSGMKTRCYNKNRACYKYYGARGIVVCNEWLESFRSFADWSVANGYRDGLTIHRKESDGNYEPSNCIWADQDTQANEKSNTVYLTAWGETKSASRWSRDVRCAVAYETLSARVRKGWEHEAAIATPPRSRPHSVAS